MRDPSLPILERPNRDANFNPRRSRCNREQERNQSSNENPNVSPQGRRNRTRGARRETRNSPPREIPRENGRDFIPENVGRVMYDSLKIFDLGYAATLPEVTANFRALARIYHPDQHNPERTGLSSDQAKEYFQMLGNARDYLKSNM